VLKQIHPNLFKKLFSIAQINYAILIFTMKIYLDTCCLNRPFDDQGQERIRLETESVMIIIARLSRKEWIWLGSQALDIEIDRSPDTDQRSRMYRISGYIGQVVAIEKKELKRASELEKLGFGGFDAVHLACA
jgi:hypothetical protein